MGDASPRSHAGRVDLIRSTHRAPPALRESATSVHEPVKALLMPRWHEDVGSRRRTLLHWPLLQEQWRIGDTLLLYSEDRGHISVAEVAEIAQVRLRESVASAVDLVALGVLSDGESGDPVSRRRAADAYLTRWGAVHAGYPTSGDPWVHRVSFRYASFVGGDAGR